MQGTVGNRFIYSHLESATGSGSYFQWRMNTPRRSLDHFKLLGYLKGKSAEVWRCSIVGHHTAPFSASATRNMAAVNCRPAIQHSVMQRSFSDISEELIVSIMKVTRIGELGKTATLLLFCIVLQYHRNHL
jgi:hypothetical protein